MTWDPNLECPHSLSGCLDLRSVDIEVLIQFTIHLNLCASYCLFKEASTMQFHQRQRTCMLVDRTIERADWERSWWWLLVGCSASQQHARAFQGRVCSDSCTCCHNEMEVTDQNFSLTQSHFIDTGPTNSEADPIAPGVWQVSHWSTNS